MFEVAVTHQNIFYNSLLSKEVATNEDTKNYHLLFKKVTTHQYDLLPKEVVIHHDTLDYHLLSKEATTPQETYLLSKEVATHQNSINYCLLSKESTPHQDSTYYHLLSNVEEVEKTMEV